MANAVIGRPQAWAARDTVAEICVPGTRAEEDCSGPARFARGMAAMARDLLAQNSVGTTLEHITQAATQRVAGCDAAGILLLHGKRVETLAPHPRPGRRERPAPGAPHGGPLPRPGPHQHQHQHQHQHSLMGSHRLTEEQAFDVLRRNGQERNVKPRAVARRVGEEGRLTLRLPQHTF
ncbi:ANTAR domain-containing protein [Streptomyces massasporeus]|uniref:ANTAR domain-containing protein n=1 Tax=Streptomyces massasporeus TaxID=67324 RepID=UPI00381BB401